MTDTSVAAWQKSRSCNGASSCVEVLSVDGCVLVRDSKLGEESPILRFTVGQWWSYIAAVRSGHAYNGPVIGAGTYNENDTWRVWHRDEPGTVLTFDRDELRAFRDGIMSGEFNPDVLASAGEAPRGLSVPPLTAS